MAAAAITVLPEDVAQAGRTNERIPEPCVVVIFGASGDLTKRKLLPALFHLEQAGLLPEQFRIVGVARRDLGASFAEDMKSGILEFGGVKPEASKLDEFIAKVNYHAMNFDDDEGYSRLKSLLEKYDREGGTKGNRLFYLAVAPEFFADAGLLAEPNDPASLADCLVKVLADPEVNAQQREKSLARANEFSWERTARGNVGVYRHVLERRASRR